MKNTKKFKKAALITSLILVGVGTILMIQSSFYPNVVSDIPPVKKAGPVAKAALRNVAASENRDSMLEVAIQALPVDGRTLQEKIAHWVGYEIDKIDSMKFKLISGLGISATSAEKQVREGYAYHEVIVQIFSKGKMYEYFLECANGLVSRRWPNKVNETSIGETRDVIHASSYSGGSSGSTGPETIVVFKGGSLWKTLDIRTQREARAFAKKYHYKYWYEKGKLIVNIPIGEPFIKVNGAWQPVNMRSSI